MVMLMFIFNVTRPQHIVTLLSAPLRKFLRGAVICNVTPTQGNRDAFSARLKQLSVLVQAARVAAGNWFQSCEPYTANAYLSYLSVVMWNTEVAITTVVIATAAVAVSQSVAGGSSRDMSR